MTQSADLRERLAGVRHDVIQLAEQLHRRAMGAVGDAEKALAEFDRQSEGALADANAATEKARAALFEEGKTANGPRLAQLEQQIHACLAFELAVLRDRTRARAVLEAQWMVSGATACQAGVQMLQAADMEPLFTVRGSMSGDEVLSALQGSSLHADRPSSPNGAQP